MDTLSAALCVYLLMGYMWGSLYGPMYTFAPGAFHLPMGWPAAAEQGIAPFNGNALLDAVRTALDQDGRRRG